MGRRLVRPAWPSNRRHEARAARRCTLPVGLALLALIGASRSASAQSCLTLSYSFQPDCYRPDEGSACVQTLEHLDFGPQIAVWIQSADGTRYVDDLMVTNATAVRGIGNRPGISSFMSGPLFPYGKRIMSLPIWSAARGRLYPTVVIQDGYEEQLAYHEPVSSPEPYFCRPVEPSEIDLDAITCPSGFNSSKGAFATMASQTPSLALYYPPRRDLGTAFMAIDSDCAVDGTTIAGGCTVDALTYATLDTVKNDYSLDAVAAATPPYGGPFAGSWTIPNALVAGDYAVMVEVNKEFDSNPYHTHPNYDDSRFPGYGIDGNFGQPSVLYSVPIHIDVGAGAPVQAAASQIVGYGDWDGATGNVHPRDGTISTGVPGSGEGRLLLTDGPGGMGRVHVGLAPCVVGCSPPPAPPNTVAGLAPIDNGLTATSATFSFANAQSSGGPVSAYQIRYQPGGTLTTEGFAHAISVQRIAPGAPGSPASFTIVGLRPATEYVVGVQSIDECGQASPLAAAAFQTPAAKFTQLSGCFIATAAYGSPQQPSVSALRLVRDRLRSASAVFAIAADLYYRSGPAAAQALERSDTARALIRRLLGPLGTAAQALTQRTGVDPSDHL
jgi:hypothetical protein